MTSNLVLVVRPFVSLPGTCRNEPDLNAPCINFNATQWNDYYLIQTSAINHAFADLNADFLAGALPCPQTFLPCPLQPIVMASAFASSTFSGDASPPAGAVYLGGPSVAAEHLVFPGGASSNSVQNMKARGCCCWSRCLSSNEPTQLQLQPIIVMFSPNYRHAPRSSTFALLCPFATHPLSACRVPPPFCAGVLYAHIRQGAAHQAISAASFLLWYRVSHYAPSCRSLGVLTAAAGSATCALPAAAADGTADVAAAERPRPEHRCCARGHHRALPQAPRGMHPSFLVLLRQAGCQD